jgi:hypothetical protein
MDIKQPVVLKDHLDVDNNFGKGGDLLGSVVKKRRKKMRKHKHMLGSVVKKRRKKMRKHKHRKLLAKTRHQRRKGK